MGKCIDEIKYGKRFEFGKNWQSFLRSLTDERIRFAENSLNDFLKTNDLTDKSFLDIGSGSGLFSLAARKLGAHVHSFDFDPSSVSCTNELRNHFYPGDKNWVVSEGSALDASFLNNLGKFDIVYSWGVLHHTGNMWQAIENTSQLAKKNGYIYIGIYNDDGKYSVIWRNIKQIYCSGILGKQLISCFFIPYYFLRASISSIYRKTNIFANYKKNRGMSIFHDWKDWLGGLPYEFAKVEEIFHFFHSKGFSLENIRTSSGSTGINEFLFRKN